MNPSPVPKRINEALVSWKVDDELLIVDQENNKIHQLNSSAAFIWSQCDGNNSVEDIVMKTCAKFDIDEDQIGMDVNSTLENLIELNLIGCLEHW